MEVIEEVCREEEEEEEEEEEVEEEGKVSEYLHATYIYISTIIPIKVS